MSTPPIIEVIPAPEHGMAEPPYAPAPAPAPIRNNKQRLLLFAGLFGVCLVASLLYVWMRTPLYESYASVLTVAPEESGEPTPQTAIIRQKRQKQGFLASLTLSGGEKDNRGSSEHVTVQRQILLGVPVFQETLSRLAEDKSQAGLDTLKLTDLRNMLNVDPLPDTNMVELRAEGPNPEILAPIVNAWVDAYQALREKNTETADVNNRTSLEEQSKQLDAKILAKRQAIESYRIDHNILSDNDADNSPMLRLKGLNEALNKALDEQAKSKGRLEATRSALTQGQPVIPKEEMAGLENLEKRAQELREMKKDADRRFTPEYQALQPQLKLIPSQLAQVEQQIQEKIKSGGQTVLSQASQDAESANQAVLDLKAKIDGLKKDSADFTNRFAELEAMKADLDRLEELNRDIKSRLTKEEVKPKDAYPPIQIVERAYLPTTPFWPSYWQDSGIALALSLFGSLAVVLLYDFLTRVSENAENVQVTAMPSFQFYTLQGSLPNPQQGGEMPPTLPNQAAPLALESNLKRELSSRDIEQLWEFADSTTRTWIGLLLSGVSIAEALSLDANSIEADSGQLYLYGDSPRILTLAPALPEYLSLPLPKDDEEEISARLHLAAVDAGLPSPESINAESLRHTYIAYLARQGIRLSQLEKVIGKIPAKNLSHYSRYSPPGQGLRLKEIEACYPALTKI